MVIGKSSRIRIQIYGEKIFEAGFSTHPTKPEKFLWGGRRARPSNKSNFSHRLLRYSEITQKTNKTGVNDYRLPLARSHSRFRKWVAIVT
ncbi:MAG TPA: hypothetical protein DDW76_23135 [Cyanobacteria bacterium UBA11369]|nr:hypothetical protein [Cyanobacteria bacterium UBA11371]HBE51589.1 hypothetical protein [Cyanobacteria bacterium UBA11369]